MSIQVFGSITVAQDAFRVMLCLKKSGYERLLSGLLHEVEDIKITMADKYTADLRRMSNAKSNCVFIRL